MARAAAAASGPKQPALFAIERLDIEDSLRASGHTAIAGVDEVGRGCWAGPVFAGAVVLPPACYVDRTLLSEVTDSKLLPPAKRDRLASEVIRLALGAAIAWVEAPLIDQVNILGATRLAMRAALDCLTGAAEASGPAWGAARLGGGPVAIDYLLADAVPLPHVPLPQRAVVRGDRRCLSVAAASIVAKVARDEEMRRRAVAYPGFGFAQNKGYGTRQHVAALRSRGVTRLHRRSFAPVKYLLGVHDCMAGALPAPVDRP